MNEIEVIKRMQVVELKPGDLVVVECSNNLSDKILDSIRQQMLKGIPEGVRVIVLDGGISFRVFREPSGELEKAADALIRWFAKGVDCSPPHNLTQNLRVARQGGPTWEEDHAARAFEAKRA
jgi:hypothetical protein